MGERTGRGGQRLQHEGPKLQGRIELAPGHLDREDQFAAVELVLDLVLCDEGQVHPEHAGARFERDLAAVEREQPFGSTSNLRRRRDADETIDPLREPFRK